MPLAPRFAASAPLFGEPLANAGGGAGDRFVDRDLTQHLRVVDLNVRSAVQLTGLLMPPMVEHGTGRVTFTSSIAATMPGPYQSTYNERAGIEDTKLGQSKKDDPREVARDGIDALFADADHVVAGSAKNKAQVGMAKVLPDRAVAAMHAKQSAPGSGRK